MTINMHQVDRVVRAVIAVAVLLAWVLGWIGGAFAIVLGVIAAVFLLTSVTGFCPLYRLLGLSTRRTAPN
jgi:hypothetical protein